MPVFVRRNGREGSRVSLTASRAPGRLPDLPDRGLHPSGHRQPLAHIVQQRALSVVERQPGFDPVKTATEG